MEWGNEIAVNGVRPDWLRDGEKPSRVLTNDNLWSQYYEDDHPVGADWKWCEPDGLPRILAIRLPADHPFYLVQRYNEQHGTSFVYWPGGDAAPADWDGTAVLNGEGETYNGFHGYDWHYRGPTKIIGYTRRSEPTRDTVAVERRTEAEWRDWAKRLFLTSGPDAQICDYTVGVVKALLLVTPKPTEAERIAAETGVPVETVQRVLSARQA